MLLRGLVNCIKKSSDVVSFESITNNKNISLPSSVRILVTETVSANKLLSAETVSANNFLSAETVSANKRHLPFLVRG